MDMPPFFKPDRAAPLTFAEDRGFDGRHNPLVKLSDGTKSWRLAVNGPDAYVSPDRYAKLNQHTSDADFAAIANALGGGDADAKQISQLMRQTRPLAFANDTNQLEGSAP